MVFDSEGRVLADMGALAFLESIPVVENAGTNSFETRITIRPRTVLPAEPILQALDDGNVSVVARRSRGTSWEILVTPREMLLATEYTPTNLAPARYRVEIVPP